MFQQYSYATVLHLQMDATGASHSTRRHSCVRHLPVAMRGPRCLGLRKLQQKTSVAASALLRHYVPEGTVAAGAAGVTAA